MKVLATICKLAIETRQSRLSLSAATSTGCTGTNKLPFHSPAASRSRRWHRGSCSLQQQPASQQGRWLATGSSLPPGPPRSARRGPACCRETQARGAAAAHRGARVSFGQAGANLVHASASCAGGGRANAKGGTAHVLQCDCDPCSRWRGNHHDNSRGSRAREVNGCCGAKATH
jgi:hypothetical protein